MRTRILSFTLAAALMLALTGCGRGDVRAAERKMESIGETMMQAVDPVQTAAHNLITREQAQNIALEHAALAADQVTGLRTEYDTDHGYPEFDVEFRYGNREYDYEIDAETGEILSYSVED